MSDVVWRQGDWSMDILGRTVECSCDVRTLANGRRGLREVVYSTTRSRKPGVAYDPMVFPVGLWLLTSVEVTDPPNPYLGPKFIRTDAYQKVEEWAVTQDGSDVVEYEAPTGRYVFDYGYLLHFSTSPTTLGCLKIHSLNDMLWLCDCVEMALREGRDMTLRVLAA